MLLIHKKDEIMAFAAKLDYHSAGDLQEMWVQSLGWEGPLEKEMATPHPDPCLGHLMDGET